MSKEVLLAKREEVELLKETIERIGQEYKDVAALYKKYRLIRKSIGKPMIYPLDPERIKKDLSSDEFFEFLEGLREKRI